MASIRFRAGLRADTGPAGQDLVFMREVFDESRKAYEAGERPCAALVVAPSGEILARAWNLVNSTRDFSAHAETSALIAAARKVVEEGGEGEGSPMVLRGSSLYANAEPCAMCSAGAFFSGISRIVYGIQCATLYGHTGRPGQRLWMKTGAVLGSGDRDVEVIGPVLEDEGLAAIGL